MKILILANNLGGLYRFRKDLIREMLNQGHEIALSIPTGEFVSAFQEMGCTVLETPIDRRGMNPAKDFSLFQHYSRMIRKTKADLVLSYTIKPNIYGGIAARFHHIPYAANITGLGSAFQGNSLLRNAVIRLYKTALCKAKVVFFENSSNRDELVHLGICKKEQTRVLAGAGINLDEYYYQEYPSNQTFQFLFVGRVMKEKGIHELISAAEKLKKQDGHVQ